MSEKHIGILQSQGPHLAKVVDAVRGRWPDARITIVQQSDTKSNVPACESVSVDGASALATVRAIRRLDLDGFVVMYASPRLELVASLSAATERYACPPDGSLLPIVGSGLRVAARWFMRRRHGERVLRAMERTVRTTRVSKEP